MPRHRVSNAAIVGLTLLVFAVLGVVTLAMWSRPIEEPGNATLDWANHWILGEDNAFWNRLCASTKDAALHDGTQYRGLVTLLESAGDVETPDFGTTRGDRATQPIRVHPRGVVGDASDTRWTVHLHREAGKWRVCSVTSASR